jgi:hypothetical protein
MVRKTRMRSKRRVSRKTGGKRRSRKSRSKRLSRKSRSKRRSRKTGGKRRSRKTNTNKYGGYEGSFRPSYAPRWAASSLLPEQFDSPKVTQGYALVAEANKFLTNPPVNEGRRVFSPDFIEEGHALFNRVKIKKKEIIKELLAAGSNDTDHEIVRKLVDVKNRLNKELQRLS